MSGMSDYLEKKLLDHTFRGEVYTPPTTIHLALFTTMPVDDGTGGVEVTGGSYARQAITFLATALGTGRSESAATVVFASMPAVSVVGAGLYDASTVGNLLFYKALGAPRAIAAGENLNVLAGDLALTLA